MARAAATANSAPFLALPVLFVALLACVGIAQGLSCYKCGQYNDGVGSITPCINYTATQLKECPKVSQYCILSADLGVRANPGRLAIIPLEALNPHSNAAVYDQAIVCGFGRDALVQQPDGQFLPVRSYSTINRFMNVRILGRDKCPLFNTAICAIDSDQTIFRTTCYGDSGGALVYNHKIVGVLSFGPQNCNSLQPIVFTRLYGHMRFINEASSPRGDYSNMMILEE